MLSKSLYIKIWEILIFLFLINYQVVTVILNDSIVFKYLRDIVLLLLALLIIINYGIKKPKMGWGIWVGLFVCAFTIPILKTAELETIFLFIRRYCYPLLILFVLLSIKKLTDSDWCCIVKYLINLLFILSVWGIIQAIFLGDGFLMAIGYPTKYSNAYGRVALLDSFYFGNLGIQRLVSTVSNTNVCALIWGTGIVTILLNGKTLLNRKEYLIKLVLICIAYILTFSRANFLAMAIVGGIVIWKDIPRKFKKTIIIAMILSLFVVIIGGALGNEMILRLFNWIYSTFAGTESSSSARTTIWASAFEIVKKNPFGLGFGHVGAFAHNAGIDIAISCENSYLAIAIDMGWLGAVFYVCMLVSIIVSLTRYRKCQERKTAIAIVVYLMICFMFSNHIYDLEAMFYVMSLIGLLFIRVKNNFSANNLNHKKRLVTGVQ